MQHQMVKIVFVVLLVMIIKMSRIDKTIKVAQTEGESLLASSALNVLSLQQQVKRRSELSLSFKLHDYAFSAMVTLEGIFLQE